MSDLFMQKCRWRQAVVQQYSFVDITTCSAQIAISAVNPSSLTKDTKHLHIRTGMLNRTLRKK